MAKLQPPPNINSPRMPGWLRDLWVRIASGAIGGSTNNLVSIDINGNFVDSGIDKESVVLGPSSATDNAIVRYDDTTGKLIQDSLVTISDSGSITVPESIKGPNRAKQYFYAGF